MNIRIFYTNWKGVSSWRNIRPVAIDFGSTEYHPDEQWLLKAWDNDKSAYRTFAISDIKQWESTN